MTRQERMQRYRAMRRRRKLVIAAFAPVAIALLVVPRLVAPELPMVLQWPLLLLFAVGCVIFMHSTDTCPWCGNSFHSNQNARATGFSSLLRQRCANCGEPAENDQSAD